MQLKAGAWAGAGAGAGREGGIMQTFGTLSTQLALAIAIAIEDGQQQWQAELAGDGGWGKGVGRVGRQAAATANRR